MKNDVKNGGINQYLLFSIYSELTLLLPPNNKAVLGLSNCQNKI